MPITAVVARVPEATYRRPLVAVDMSDSSRLALELALRICDPATEKIDVVHVVSPPNPVYVTEATLVLDMDQSRVEAAQRARAELLAFLDTVKTDRLWNVVLTTGDPRQAILDEAKNRSSDLIAMGTQGRTGLAHVLVGSVAEGVLRAATSDVLVARHRRPYFSEF